MSRNSTLTSETDSRLSIWAQRLKRPHTLPRHLANGLVRRLGLADQPSNVGEAQFPPPAGEDGAKSFAERFREIPDHLVMKVNAVTEEAVFQEVGRLTAATLTEHVDIAGARRVIDFGCGLGRTLLALQPVAPNPLYIAYDIDPLMLAWCRYLLGGTPLRLEYTGSSLGLRDGAHDVVYAISVFTHLDQTADYWLAEVHRLLAPNGRAFLTYLDDTLFNEIRGTADLPGTTQSSTMPTRHVLGSGMPEGGAHIGVLYNTAFWEKKLGQFFHIERTVPRGLFGHQSISVVRPKPVRPDWSELRRQQIVALERELFGLRAAQRQLF